MHDSLSIIRLTSDTAMLILIWLVQLIIYPAFRSIDSGQFTRWHHRYMHVIAWIVIPLMILQSGAIGLQLLYDPSRLHWVSSVAVLTAWVSTFTLSVPCHNALQSRGNLPELTDRIIRTNWIRTLSWSIVFLISLAQEI
jgi:hypothetical protein